MINPMKIETPCIEWVGKKHKQGYGRFWLKGRMVLAHRVAYCEENKLGLNDIVGMVIRHKCDNTSCVNPDHLEIGTQKDNVLDCHSRGRAKPQACEKNGRAKLTREQVSEIRRIYVFGSKEFGAPALAKKYGIGRTALRSAASGEAWKGIA